MNNEQVPVDVVTERKPLLRCSTVKRYDNHSYGVISATSPSSSCDSCNGIVSPKPWRLLVNTVIVVAALVTLGAFVGVQFFSSSWIATMTISLSPQLDDRAATERKKGGETLCLFQSSPIQVERNKRGFPSFWNYYSLDIDKTSAVDYDCVTEDNLRPIHVSYDHRSISLNNERVLFLGGSMYPSRLTQSTWNAALDEAVHQGLNMITIYIIWSAHQPYRDIPLDFALQQNVFCTSAAENDNIFSSKTCPWNIQQAIREVANRGLFVHVRIGPYVCAEYNYGGIPEWVPLTSANMSMRRPNYEWMIVMEDYVSEVVLYLQRHRLFAYQGGPIVLAQIENEIGDEINYSTEKIFYTDLNVNFVLSPNDIDVTTNRLRYATMQDYADWCGALVQKLAPEVVWTMCSGLSANNTISTYNGFFDDNSWIEGHGDTNRRQIDQPALWTEHEGKQFVFRLGAVAKSLTLHCS
jgi:Glycosyl hydrolases family 35